MTENHEDTTFANVPKGHNAMAIMGERGDTKIQWNPSNDDECLAAELQFNHLVKEKRYAAFRMNEDGSKGELIRRFDKTAARIIMAPQMQGG